jgi:hypothetical protein
MSLDTQHSAVTLNVHGSKPETCFKTTFKDKNRKCFKNLFYKIFAINRTNAPENTLLFGAKISAKINKTETWRLTKLTCWLAAGCSCGVSRCLRATDLEICEYLSKCTVIVVSAATARGCSALIMYVNE